MKVRKPEYDGPALDPDRGSTSARREVRKGKRGDRHDPQDRRFTYFTDPLTYAWHTLR